MSSVQTSLHLLPSASAVYDLDVAGAGRGTSNAAAAWGRLVPAGSGWRLRGRISDPWPGKAESFARTAGTYGYDVDPVVGRFEDTLAGGGVVGAVIALHSDSFGTTAAVGTILLDRGIAAPLVTTAILRFADGEIISLQAAVPRGAERKLESLVRVARAIDDAAGPGGYPLVFRDGEGVHDIEPLYRAMNRQFLANALPRLAYDLPLETAWSQVIIGGEIMPLAVVDSPTKSGFANPLKLADRVLQDEDLFLERGSDLAILETVAGRLKLHRIHHRFDGSSLEYLGARHVAPSPAAFAASVESADTFYADRRAPLHTTD
jgi:hypothetical protein